VKIAPVTGFAAAREYYRFFHDPVDAMRERYKRNGPVAPLGPIFAGQPSKPRLLIAGPELNRQVLSDPATFRTTGQLIRGPRGSAQQRIRFGLTRMNGAQHKQQRQLIMPAFHKSAVDGYHALMVEVATGVLNKWKPGRVYDIHSEMRAFVLQLSSAILFSADPDEGLAIGKLMEEWLLRNFSSSVWMLPVDLPGTAYRGLLRHAERIEKEILSMIERRRASPGKRRDVLSLLMEARDDENRGMTDEELVGQATILFGASFETAATTLTWTLFLLAQHPAVMRKLMDEFDAVLSGSAPSPDQLPKLEFLACVIKESMRVLSPVPYAIRATARRVKIGSLTLPHGSTIVCGHYLTHHMPELYPEPERFQPERWNSIDPSQYEYLPFSAGPRACIGAIFATQLLKISLTLMLQRFRFAVVPGTRIDRVARITMQPRHGMPMMIFDNDRQYASSRVAGQIHEMVELP
jgi:cytochrome P450